MISIVDYGMGNLRSVQKAFELFSRKVRIISSPNMIAGSSVLVLPGDGAFGMAMDNLRLGGWIEPILRYIEQGGLFVGICVGYQLLFESSEEFGTHTGLGLVRGRVRPFSTPSLKVPHMGWNTVSIKKCSPYLAGVTDETYFYFIHTYHPVAEDDVVIGETEYGETFPSMIQKDNIFGLQFHPEKSHAAGLKIIQNITEKAC